MTKAWIVECSLYLLFSLFILYFEILRCTAWNMAKNLHRLLSPLLKIDGSPFQSQTFREFYLQRKNLVRNNLRNSRYVSKVRLRIQLYRFLAFLSQYIFPQLYCLIWIVNWAKVFFHVLFTHEQTICHHILFFPCVKKEWPSKLNTTFSKNCLIRKLILFFVILHFESYGKLYIFEKRQLETKKINN